MEEKLLDVKDNMTLKDVIEEINKIVKKKQEIVENNDDMGKWTSLPVLLLEEDNEQERILKYIDFVDNMFISRDEKISYIITLAILIKDGHLDISTVEDGHLFILADYFNERTNDAIENELLVVNEPSIIEEVRNKTLENDTRVKLLEYAYKMYQEKNITEDGLSTFAKEFAEMITKLDYYELLKLINE